MGGPGGQVQTCRITSLSNLASVRKQNNLEELSERELETGAMAGIEVQDTVCVCVCICVCVSGVDVKTQACSQACVLFPSIQMYEVSASMILRMSTLWSHAVRGRHHARTQLHAHSQGNSIM